MNNIQLYKNIMKSISESLHYVFEDLEDDSYDEDDFYLVLLAHGELEHDELIDILGENIYDSEGNVIDSLLIENDTICYSYFMNGTFYSREFNFQMLTDEQYDAIYNYLKNDFDPNFEFFNNLK